MLVALMSTAVHAAAQISVGLSLEQKHFLPNEQFEVTLTITNLSGQPLRLGHIPEWLTFSIEPVEGAHVSEREELKLVQPFELPSSKVGTRKLDLAPYYDLSIPGRYRVTATVYLPDRDERISSPPVGFEVVRGTRVWEQVVGVPGAPSQTTRKYIVQQTRLLNQVRLYLRVTDGDESRTVRVHRLGPLVSFGVPDTLVDDRSRLHLLHQVGSKSFQYFCFDTEGDLLKRERYEIGQFRPRLQSAPDGTVLVKGGVKVAIPEPLTLQEKNDPGTPR